MLLPFTGNWVAAMDNIETTDGQEMNGVDEILEYAFRHFQDGSYPPNLTKDKKRAVRKRAALLTVDKGEVFFTRGKAKVKVLVSHQAERWKDELSLARSVCDHCCLGERSLFPQREGRKFI